MEVASPGVTEELRHMFSVPDAGSEDDAQEAEWLRKAAAQGDAFVQERLGIKLAKGKTVCQDYTESYFWLSLAALQGHELAAKWRDGVAKQLAPTQRADVEERVRCWKPR